MLKFLLRNIRTIKKMKAVILVILAATALAAPTEVEGDSSCLTDLMACVAPVKAVVADIQAIAGGDTSHIASLLTDGKALLAAVEAAASACGITEPAMFSVQCF